MAYDDRKTGHFRQEGSPLRETGETCAVEEELSIGVRVRRIDDRLWALTQQVEAILDRLGQIQQNIDT